MSPNELLVRKVMKYFYKCWGTWMLTYGYHQLSDNLITLLTDKAIAWQFFWSHKVFNPHRKAWLFLSWNWSIRSYRQKRGITIQQSMVYFAREELHTYVKTANWAKWLPEELLAPSSAVCNKIVPERMVIRPHNSEAILLKLWPAQFCIS